MRIILLFTFCIAFVFSAKMRVGRTSNVHIRKKFFVKYFLKDSRQSALQQLFLLSNFARQRTQARSRELNFFTYYNHSFKPLCWSEYAKVVLGFFPLSDKWKHHFSRYIFVKTLTLFCYDETKIIQEKVKKAGQGRTC